VIAQKFVYVIRNTENDEYYSTGYPQKKVVPAMYASLSIAKRQAKFFASSIYRNSLRASKIWPTSHKVIPADEAMAKLVIEKYAVEFVEVISNG
jgi:hypothetical protein